MRVTFGIINLAKKCAFIVQNNYKIESFFESLFYNFRISAVLAARKLFYEFTFSIQLATKFGKQVGLAKL